MNYFLELLGRSAPVCDAIPHMMTPATDLSAGVAVDVVEETNQGHQGWGGIGAVLLLVMVDGSQCVMILVF